MATLAELYFELYNDAANQGDDIQADYYWSLCIEYHNKSLKVNRPFVDIAQEPF
jgi:hypothetical protein